MFRKLTCKVDNVMNSFTTLDPALKTQFFNTTSLCFLAVFFANFIFSFIYDYPIYSKLIYFLAALFTIAINIVLMKVKSKKTRDILIISFFLAVNTLFFPLLYFTCGGIRSSVAMYFILGIVFTILNLDKKQLVAVLSVEGIAYLIVFTISFLKPEIERQFIEINNERYVSTALGFIITGLAAGFVLRSMVKAYEVERKKEDDLVGKLEDLTTHDALTGAYNRRFLMSHIEKCIKRVNDGDLNTFSIIMFDLDHFKRVNDTYGHVVGDEVLQSFATVLKNSMRDKDVVARYGGEEFIIVLPTSDELSTYRRADQIRSKLESTSLSDDIKERITVSGGICGYDLALSSESMIEKADNNLYLAKEHGRNQIVWRSGESPPVCYSVFE